MDVVAVSGAFSDILGRLLLATLFGAGVIRHRTDGRGVEGLTTAAAIWIVAAIGVATGAG